MQFIDPVAEEYAKQFSSPLDEILKRNEVTTLEHNKHAVMHSGHVQGKVLEFLSRMIKPRQVLEIGTFTGFSALCLAKGLTSDGHLHTIEVREEDAEDAKSFISEAGESERITVHTGNAIDLIPQLNEQWDLVFIDADKVSYIEYYELTLPRLSNKGWIIADNVLFHGQVLGDNVKGKNALAIQSFNKHVANDSRVEQVLLTVRDGLMIIRKL